MKLSFYANAMMVLPFVFEGPEQQYEVVSRAQSRGSALASVTVGAELSGAPSSRFIVSAGLLWKFDIAARTTPACSIASSLFAAAAIVSRTSTAKLGAQVATQDVALVYNLTTFAATELGMDVKSGVEIEGRTYLVTGEGVSLLASGAAAADVETAPVRFGRPVVLGDVYVDMAGVSTELHVSTDCGDVAYRLLTDSELSSYQCRTGGLKLTRARLRLACKEVGSVESITAYPITLTRGGKPR